MFRWGAGSCAQLAAAVHAETAATCVCCSLGRVARNGNYSTGCSKPEVTRVSAADAPRSHPQLRSVTFRQQVPVEQAHLDAWLSQVSGTVQRAKGWIEFAEQPGNHYLLQMVGDRIQLTRGQLPQSAGPALVVIARDIDALPDPFAD